MLISFQVSDCLSCECTEGRLKCKRTLQVNFPGKHSAYVPFNESCEQPGCNAVEFIKARRETCEGTRQVKDLNSIYAESYLKDRFNQISIHHQDSPTDLYLSEKATKCLPGRKLKSPQKPFSSLYFYSRKLVKTG